MSGLFGFLISALTNLPSGAVIVLFSSALLIIAPAIKKFMK
jgi:ABC-type Mn2+/Zn2+ transport system permease subunit